MNPNEVLIPPYLKALMELWPLFTVLSALLVGGIMLYLGTKFMPRKACEQCREDIAGEQEVVATECKALALRQTDALQRLRDLETATKALPSAQDISNLTLGIERLSGRMSEHQAILKRVEMRVDRIDDYFVGREK